MTETEYRRTKVRTAMLLLIIGCLTYSIQADTLALQIENCERESAALQQQQESLTDSMVQKRDEKTMVVSRCDSIEQLRTNHEKTFESDIALMREDSTQTVSKIKVLEEQSSLLSARLTSLDTVSATMTDLERGRDSIHTRIDNTHNTIQQMLHRMKDDSLQLDSIHLLIEKTQSEYKEKEQLLSAQSDHISQQITQKKTDRASFLASLSELLEDSVMVRRNMEEEAQVLQTREASLDSTLKKNSLRKDSLTSEISSLESDSAGKVEIQLDTLQRITRQLDNLNTAISLNDSVITLQTNKVQQFRADSIEAVTLHRQTMGEIEQTSNELDSAIAACQKQKNAYDLIHEKQQLDAQIASLQEQLVDFLQLPYDERSRLTGPEPALEQKLNIYRGKREIILKNRDVQAILQATPSDPGQQKTATATDSLIAVHEQKLLDFSRRRENTAARLVQETESYNISMSKRSATISNLLQTISDASKERINDKALREKLQNDSAIVSEKLDGTRSSYITRLELARAELEAANLETPMLMSKKDSITAQLASIDERHDDDFASLRERMKPQLDRIATIDKEIDTLRQTRAETVADSQNLAQEYQTKLNTVKNRKTEILQTISARRDSLSGRLRLLESLRTDSVDAQQRLITVQAEKAGQKQILSDSISALTRNITGLEATVEQLEKDRSARTDRYHEGVASLTEALRSCRKELQAVEKHLAALEQRKTELMTELESISSRCQEFRNQQTALKQKQEQQRLERMRQDSISRLPAKAEEELLLIYRILEEQDSEDARDRFIESQDLLETWLEKEAYRTISELLEPSESPNPSTPQLAVSPDPSPSPSPDSPVTPARESAPSETAMSQRPDSPTQPLGPRPEPDGSVFFSSLPPHAVVYMDGHQIGLTNSGDIAITSGTHRMHFVRGDKTCTREMTFTPGKNPTVMITLPCQK